MSPIPPNKEINPNNNSQKPTNSEDSLNPSEVQLNEANAAVAAVEELVDDDQQQGRTYQPLEQNPTRAATSRQGPDHPPGEDDEDEDDDDDDDTDSEPDELDPDEHFAMLASSRAFAKKTQKDQENDAVKYAHSFDCDVFERKRTLESEEIELDESKSRQISNLTSEFKLPDESIPSWAKLVPEHVWKKNLLECLSAKKLDLFATNEQQSSSSN